MEITISVSNKTAEIIQHKAEENGKNIDEFLGEFVEEKLSGDAKDEPKIDKNYGENRERKHNLLEFAGMFASGKTDTSERMHEILYSEDFDSAEGFSVK